MNEVKPLLIFPPGWSPFGPYSALPVLKGYLEEHGVESKVIDLNLDFYNTIFSKEFMISCYNKCISKFNYLNNKEQLNSYEKQEFIKYSKIALLKGIEKHIDEAKGIMKTYEYYNEDKAKFSREVLFNALYLAGAAYNAEFRFNRFTLKYTVRSTNEIMKALIDEESNPFINFFRNGIINTIKESEYNVIALSITGNSQLIPSLTLAKLIKEECPNIKHISVGGNYITRIVEDWTEEHEFFQYIDSIMTFEGEKAIYSLMKSIENNSGLETVPNLLYVKDGILHRNESSILKIEEFSIANYDDLPLDDYYMPEKVIPIFTSRSCFCKCAFCSIPYSSKGKYRSLEICSIFENMKLFYNKYKVKHFAFVDETFTSEKMIKLSELIQAEGLPFKWYGETRFNPNFTEEFCKQLYAGGCRKLQFGLESYNQNILDKMHKNIKKEWIKPTIENCFKAGIAVHMFFMVGFPGESKEQALNTILFTRSMLKESNEKYNNANTTFGWDVFGLDKYSDVWINPDDYGLTIKNSSDYYDLDIQYDFEVKQGMNQDEAKKII